MLIRNLYDVLGCFCVDAAYGDAATADRPREVLAVLGYKEGVGYDDRGSTRFLASVPAGQVETLLKGLRHLPAGARQPPPLRNVTVFFQAEDGIRVDLVTGVQTCALPI